MPPKRAPDQTESGRYVVITQQLRALADQLREAFIRIRRNFVPGSSGVGASQDKHFLWAAMLCMSYGLTAERYCYLVLDEVFRTSRQPYPNVLSSRTMIEQALQHQEQDYDQWVVKYRSQLDTFRDLLRSFTAEQIMTSSMASFSPLFRYVVGLRYQLPAVADAARDDARLEAKVSPVAQDLFVDEVKTL